MVLGRGRREKKTARMAELIFNEQLGSDESGNEAVVQSSKPMGERGKGNRRSAPSATLPTSNSFDRLSVEEASDANDNDYEAKESSDSASSTDIEEITNEEVCQLLFSRNTLPKLNGISARKQPSVKDSGSSWTCSSSAPEEQAVNRQETKGAANTSDTRKHSACL
jgi:hypothetical protein